MSSINYSELSSQAINEKSTPWNYLKLIKFFLMGASYPIGFAPFNFPGFTILSIALFYNILLKTNSKKQIIIQSFIYATGIFVVGTSWVIISIHDYGQINYILAFFITLLFVSYLALFYVFLALCFNFLSKREKLLYSSILFSCLWCLGEFLRANLFTGFPWLLAGTSQLNTPLKYLAPVIGSYGLSFLTCIAACFLTNSFIAKNIKQFIYLISFLIILVLPMCLSNVKWTNTSDKIIKVATIQSNLAMRDKWDENLFWKILNHYKTNIRKLKSADLIVLPESSIPIPKNYIEDYIEELNEYSFENNSGIVLGILSEAPNYSDKYNNSMISLGLANGSYAKKHLVPFGEYIPLIFKKINQLFLLPDPGLEPGDSKQTPQSYNNIPFASLICYEISYPELLRQQMPISRFIISISDNGWFGHSLASYQQLQMARMLSLQSGRYQILANNDGLSSVIDNNGKIINQLPAFSSGILHSKIKLSTGATPWVLWGDKPLAFMCLFFVLFSLVRKIK